MSEDRARSAAYAVVRAVEVDGAYANLVAPTILRDWGLTGRDAAFATELAYGSLRMQGWYDAIIAHSAKRQPQTLDAPVRHCLWLGVHQVISMRVPAHAAVSQTVDQVRQHAGAGAAKFANAVMRRVTEREPEAWVALLAPGPGREALGLRTSHPAWVVEALAKALEADGRAGELASLLESHNVPAKVSVVARPGLADQEELLRSHGASAARWSPHGITLESGSPGDIPAVAEGRAGIQDEGSQVVAAALAAHTPVRNGERWLDMCAGPGGKTALLGGIASAHGANVDAVELHPHRAELVRQSVSALPAGTVTVHGGDARHWSEGPYDRILVDAPCTGLGALRRRPEARWRRSATDLDALGSLQHDLLAHAAARLAPDGVIAYVTCSPVLAETQEVIRSVPELTSLDARPSVAHVTGTATVEWGRGPHVQWWTHAHGTDSMFLALLRHS